MRIGCRSEARSERSSENARALACSRCVAATGPTTASPLQQELHGLYIAVASIYLSIYLHILSRPMTSPPAPCLRMRTKGPHLDTGSSPGMRFWLVPWPTWCWMGLMAAVVGMRDVGLLITYDGIHKTTSLNPMDSARDHPASGAGGHATTTPMHMCHWPSP